MKKSIRDYLFIIFGSIFTLLGLAGGYIFYHFDLGFFKVTIWRDVITFSLIALVGIVLLIIGIKNRLRAVKS